MPRQDQGVTPNRYCVIPRVLIFIFRGEEVLLLKGNSNKRIWPSRYNGIGGHIERGEDVLSAARRELKEETGISNGNLRLCGTVTVDIGEDRGIALYVFKGIFIDGLIKESNEGSLEWVSLEKISEYELVEDLPVILPKVFSMTRSMSPFSAHYSYDRNERLVIQFGE